MTTLYDKKGGEVKITHQVDVSDWLATGEYFTEAPEEEDFSTPLLEYIDSLDEETSIAFQDRMEEVQLELKKDGSFNASTIKKLNALVFEIQGADE